jgi:hypothetical protein
VEVKRRLFGPAESPRRQRHTAWPQWAVATSGALALFVAVGVVAPRRSGHAGASGIPVMALSVSNVTRVTYLLPAAAAGRNAPPVRRIEWTNRTASP